MTQTLVDVSKLKDFDSRSAIDSLATSVVAAGITGSTGVISVASGKTLTASNSLTFTGTDGTSFAFPGSSDTVVTLAASQQLSGKTLVGVTAGTNAAASLVGEVMGGKLFGTATTATVTITSANPGVVTWTTHGFSTTIPQPVVFTTTGGLPTNITAGTVYYTVPSSVTTSTFTIATSTTNALAGTQVDCTAGAQSGVQTGTAGAKMATGTAIDISAIALTAGDWDVWAEIVWNANAATTWTVLEGSISQTTATLATAGAVVGSTYASLNQISAAATNGVTSLEMSPCQINVSSTTNVFLVVKGAFATNILGAYGYIFARRRR